MKLSNLILAAFVLVSSNVAFATDCKAKKQSGSLFESTVPAAQGTTSGSIVKAVR